MAARNKHKRKNTSAQDHTGKKKRNTASLFFAITGAVAGLVISFFASERNFFWMGAGSIAGAYLGYILGNRMDKQAN